MMNFFRAVLLLLFGLMSLGSGLCTLGFLPTASTSPDLLIFLIPSGLFAVGCFFAARQCYRGLSKKPEDDSQS